MSYEQYSDAQLYSQLRYFASLFDAEKAVKGAKGTSQQGDHHLTSLALPITEGVIDELIALTSMNATFLHAMGATVSKYVDRSGRRWVDMSGLFSFMSV